MRNYTFELHLGVSEITDELEDALYVAGCDDATLVKVNDRVTLTFTRHASDLETAIQSAKADVTKAGVLLA